MEKHTQFLQEAQLNMYNNPPEATAWENGFVPEAEGIPSDQLEFRIQGSLPPLAFMVSRPRQPTTAGEELMRRFDAEVRSYWLRDWQSRFGGYTKVYEYQVDGETRRKFSVSNCVLTVYFRDKASLTGIPGKKLETAGSGMRVGSSVCLRPVQGNKGFYTTM